MALSRLDIQQLRNLTYVRLQPGPGFNLLWGSNGAGKSSVLEAIHLLGRGVSFRSNDLKTLLSLGAERALVSGRSCNSGTRVGVEFGRAGISYHIDGKPAANRAALSERLPVLFLGPDSHKFFTDGPQQRRRFLDWGVFHVEPQFLPAWRRFQRALKQRNMALRCGQDPVVWDAELIKNGLVITEQRAAYLQKLIIPTQDFLDALGVDLDLSFLLAPGWREDSEYAEVLRAGLEQDKLMLYTRYGPHRADLILKTSLRPAKDIVSRGQQKLIICALTLAQALIVNEGQGVPCILLIDDLAAELDAQHRQQFLNLLAGLDSQIFLTALDTDLPQLLPQAQWKMFHVKQGAIE